jgi:uncharacterized membrane protein AbrB (regulator of aidB expression)
MTLLPGSRDAVRPAQVRVVCALLLLFYLLGMAVQPAADGPDTAPTTWSDELFWLVQAGLLVVLAGVLTGRSWAAWAGLVTGVLLLAQVVSCPLRGHHEFAPWWFAQLALSFLGTVLPAALVWRAHAGSGSEAESGSGTGSRVGSQAGVKAG